MQRGKSSASVGMAETWIAALDKAVRTIRMSILMLALGAGVLTFAPQSLDAVVVLGERDGLPLWLGWGLFLGASVWWAMCLWYSARVFLHLDPPWPPGRRSPWRDLLLAYLPRLLSALAFLSVLCVLWRAQELGRETSTRVMTALVAAAAVAAHLFYHWRRRWLLRANPANTHYRKWDALTSEVRRWFGGFLAVSALLLVAVVIAPVAVGRLISAGPLMLAAFAGWAAFGALVTWMGRRWGVPVIAFMALLFLIFSMSNTVYPLRRLAGEPPPRPTLQQAFDRWYEHVQHGTPPERRNEPPTLVIVATAGGGIRAAYWTALVLGTLQDDFPRFRDHLFAISGVSGGSLGASVFTNLLSMQHDGRCYAGAGAKVLSDDFLGPAVGWLLYADIPQKLLPYAVINRALGYDRAAALEEAWERSWSQHLDNSGLFSQGFLANSHAAASAGQWRPILILNGTDMDEGSRVVTTDVQLDLPGAVVDFFQYAHHDIRSSTAVTNSARFPLISPPGTAERRLGGMVLPDLHIVDGGYIDNFGALTASELIDRLATVAKGKPVKVAVIQIVSDPEPPRRPSSAPPDLLSGLLTLLHVREMIGASAASDLWAEHAHGGRVFRFELGGRVGEGGFGGTVEPSGIDGQRPPPLGWALAKPSREYMWKNIGDHRAKADAWLAEILSEQPGSCRGKQ